MERKLRTIPDDWEGLFGFREKWGGLAAGGTPAATGRQFSLAGYTVYGHFLSMSEGNPLPDDAAPPDPLVSGLHFRGRLPHLKKENVVYFVTFRLADSLPAREIARLKHERQAILEQARAAKSPLTWHEEEQLLAWYCDRVEALLDAGHGACWLRRADVAGLVAQALRLFDGQRYSSAPGL